MSRLPPVPPANRPAWGPDAAPKAEADAARRLRRRSRRHETAETDASGPTTAMDRAADASPIAGISLPALKLGIAGFAGYVLGYLVARRR